MTMSDSADQHKDCKKLRRAGRACLNCRARKVKCNVVESDPCSNCRWDKTRCVVPRNRRTRKFVFAPDSQVIDSIQESPPHPHEYPPAVYCEPGTHPENSPPHSHQNAHQHASSQSPTALTGSPSAAAVFTNRCDEPSDLPSFIVPHPPDVDPAYLLFLRNQGALTLPSLLLQAALVKCYVEECYGRMPLLDLESLCDALGSEDGSNGQVSLLLYQAVLLVGAGHVASNVLRDAGCPDRMGFRKDLCRRIELLFDSNIEKDDLVLIQTALLVGYSGMSYTNRKDSWYWLNTAITLAYSMDLHRDTSMTGIPIRRERLLRRVWWCCYARDKILSHGMQRPTRIKAQDCHVSMLDMSDMECNVLTRPRPLLGGCAMAGGFSLSQQMESAELCVEKTKLCVLIGHILELESQAARATDAMFLDTWPCQAVEVEAASAALQSWYASLPESCRFRPLSLDKSDNHQIMSSVGARRYLLHMSYHSAVFSLHRPRLASGHHDSLCNTSPNMASDASGKLVLHSAKNITRLAAELHDQDYDNDLPLGALFALSPAIRTNLVNINNPSATVSRLAVFGLRVCIRLLWRLRELYQAPDATIRQLEATLQGGSLGAAGVKSIADLVQLNSLDQTDISAVLGRPSPWVPMATPSMTLAEDIITGGLSQANNEDTTGTERRGSDDLSRYSPHDSTSEFLPPDLSSWLRADELLLPIDGTLPLVFS